MEVAEAVGRSGQAAGAHGADDAAAHDAQHAAEGPGRVEGEHDVVHGKGGEGARLADGPGLLVA